MYFNDPEASPKTLALQGTVRSLIDVRPSTTVSFKGTPGKIGQSTLELVADTLPFHVTKVETNLEAKVAHQLETVQDGKRYRLKLTNLAGEGRYSGFVKVHTDLAQKREIMIRVIGAIEAK